MFSERVYAIAFTVSLIAHGVILLQVSNLSTLPANKGNQKIEVSYIKSAESLHSPARGKAMGSEPFLKLPQKIAAVSRNPPPFVDRENIYKGLSRDVLSDSGLTKPALIKPDVIAVKKKITLPALNIDKINNPSYIGYYQIVREKIRRCAYLNYARTETGEVYLSFIISEGGNLKEVRFVDEKSSNSPYLREIALRSIKEASPFPDFPKDLNYPQLSFNVVISFEIEQ